MPHKPIKKTYDPIKYIQGDLTKAHFTKLQLKHLLFCIQGSCDKQQESHDMVRYVWTEKTELFLSITRDFNNGCDIAD